MNNLSILIILADILPSLSTALCVASFLCFCPATLLWFLGVTNFCGDATKDKYRESLLPLVKPFRRAGWASILFFVLWVMSFAIPDRPETYYAVAASEMGEEVIKSETAGKALQALDSWLDAQLDTDSSTNTEDNSDAEQ